KPDFSSLPEVENLLLADQKQLLELPLRYVADRWRMDYNHYRRHSSVGYMAPASVGGEVF
ncbi:MAG: transposase, partial [Planctomycetes bacterium]|nr:transposase [Planctomycetota bacterium]